MKIGTVTAGCVGLWRCSLLVIGVAAVLASGPSASWAQGEIVGWVSGPSVIVGPEALSDLTAVAAGLTHSLGLKTDGSIVAWGNNTHGQCTVPTPNTGFTAVAAGSDHSLGLKADGSIVAWGDNEYGQCTVPTPNAGFTAVAAGSQHSLGLKTDGSIVAWGQNYNGQCTVPTPNAGFTAVAAGMQYSLGLKTDGSVVAWGDNHFGQCTVPTPNTGFTAVAAGSWHSLGLITDGSIVAWGANDSGQCTVPAPNTGFTAVAAGEFYSLGLKTDGSIVAWGLNEFGVCTVPMPNTGFTAVAAGEYHSLGLKTDGPVVAWGENVYSQGNVPPPNAGFTAVALSRYHNLGLKTDGSIVAWGLNDYGQCTVPPPNAGFTAVAAGMLHSLGLKTDGSIVAWGSVSGEPPSPNTGFASVAAGWSHSLGLKTDGSIVAWGSNDYGQCTVPTPNTGFTAVAAGTVHSLGLKIDGSIVAWGDNYFGQCTVPTPNTGFTSMAADWGHSLGLKTDGSIVAWGWNDSGQCNVPVPNTGFTAVAAGSSHSLGLKTDGSIVAWGYNDVPTPNSGYFAIAASGLGSLAIRDTSSPAEPAGLQGIYVRGGQIDLTWDDASNFERGFRIERAQAETGPWVEVGRVPRGTAHFQDSGLTAGMIYYYRVIAYNGLVDSTPSNVAVGYVNALPHGVPVTAEVTNGSDGLITIRLHDENVGPESGGVVSAKLFYRLGGSTDLAPVDSLTLTIPESTYDWTATIPAAYVTERGVQYCLTIEDRYESVRIPAGTAWLNLPVTINALDTFHLGASAFELTGVPLSPTDPTPDALFQELGAYDARRWRYWTSWNAADSTYAEHEAAAPAVPGQGFWVIAQAAADIHVSGTSTPLDQVFKIPLQPGWNMVADPYAFDVPAEWIAFPAAGETALRAYNPLAGNYVIEGGLESRRGYFLWLNDEAPDTLRITVPGAADAVITAVAPDKPKATSTARLPLTFADTGWRVRAEARCGERTDRDNWFGQFAGATAEKDRVDLMETPPPPGDYVGLSFRSAVGEALMTDYRSPAAGEDGSDGTTWTLVLNSNLRGTEAQVSFAVERPLPAGWRLVAIDPASLTATDLLAQPELTVRLGGGSVHRQSWRLAAGPASYVEGIRQGVEAEFDRNVTTVLVGEAWPNPFRMGSGMEISLASPRREMGEVSVYNVRGQLVRRLFTGEIAHGWQRYLWDGRDDRGQTAAAGVYLVRATVGAQKQSRKVTLVR